MDTPEILLVPTSAHSSEQGIKYGYCGQAEHIFYVKSTKNDIKEDGEAQRVNKPWEDWSQENQISEPWSKTGKVPPYHLSMQLSTKLNARARSVTWSGKILDPPYMLLDNLHWDVVAMGYSSVVH